MALYDSWKLSVFDVLHNSRENRRGREAAIPIFCAVWGAGFCRRGGTILLHPKLARAQKDCGGMGDRIFMDRGLFIC